MQDRHGNNLVAGDKFIYQVGRIFECTGEIISLNNVDTIKWDDDSSLIPVDDFYYAPIDKGMLQKI